MATFYVVSDVHSFYHEMMSALDKAGFDINNKNDIFVSCGDLCDRGPDPIKCLEFVNNLSNDRKILIKGNHEDLMEDAINRGYFGSHDYHNRTNETAYAISGMDPNKHDSAEILNAVAHSEIWNKYINSCVDYYEDDKHIFVHGWIPTKDSFDKPWLEPDIIYLSNWREATRSMWDSARWSNGMQIWSNGIKEPGKTIYCGHFHASWGHHYLHRDGPEWPGEFKEIMSELGYIMKNKSSYPKFTPFEDDGICCLDACTAISGFVNCKKIGKVKKPNEEQYHICRD